MRFQFENLTLDADRRELLRDGAPVAVEPQVFDLLLFLVQNCDRVVTKDEVLDAVWKGRIVSESTLTSRINAARKALGDSGDGQRLLRTFPRKGLRFVGEVQSSPAPAANQRARPTAPAEVLTLPDRPSIAVLAFENLSGDADQEYFADGIAEDIITELSRYKLLFVIARNSSFTYKGRVVEVKQIGRELGVAYVLEGSVRRSPTRIRVTAQLVDTASGAHVWAERYDRELTEQEIRDFELTYAYTTIIG